jgi:hypothetical protein
LIVMTHNGPDRLKDTLFGAIAHHDIGLGIVAHALATLQIIRNGHLLAYRLAKLSELESAILLVILSVLPLAGRSMTLSDPP